MKYFILNFGTGNPSSFTGLTPTFTVFSTVPGGTPLSGVTTFFGLSGPPGISEIPTMTGLYTFAYEPTSPIVFVVDGGPTLSGSSRYIRGILDPIQAVDDKVGFPTDSIGTTAIDPTSLYGLAKRNLEIQEGDGYFDKVAGNWQQYNRGALGNTTLLRQKTVGNNTGNVTKTGL